VFLVVLARLSKGSGFIPTTDYATAIDVAGPFVTHVFAKHGIPHMRPLIAAYRDHKQRPLSPRGQYVRPVWIAFQARGFQSVRSQLYNAAVLVLAYRRI